MKGILLWPFVGSKGLRSGWRILLWVLTWGLLSAPIGIALHFLFPGRESGQLPFLAMTVVNSISVLPVVAGTWLCARVLDRRGLAWAGLGGPWARALRNVSIGSAAGAAMIAFALLVDCAGGLPSISLGHGALWRIGVEVVGLLGAAALEELLFRGYLFQQLTRGLGFAPALVLSSLLFVAAHLGNNAIGVTAVLNILIAGLWLGCARALTGDLWLAIGLHFGWNAAQGLLFGVPISGITGFDSVAVTTLHGTPLFTGGAFGFEASIGGLAALGLGAAVMAALARRRETDWSLGTKSAPEPAPAPVPQPDSSDMIPT